MIILDTDCLSLLNREKLLESSKLRQKLEQFSPYEKLHRALEAYRNTTVLDFDEKAAKVFQDLKSQKIRIGTMDVKIASIAISCKAILVSRNLKDFENVPNLVVKDWTR